MRTFSAITSRRPFTLLGILLAVIVIVAFVLVALNASQSGTSPQETVVVASKDLQPRIPISADALSMRAIPVPATYPKVYFNRIQDVQGLVPLVTITSGQAVAANEVAQQDRVLGSQSAYLPIPKGYVALTIPTSEQTGVAGYIQPGDYIAVIATVDQAGKVGSRTIFTQLHVIKVGAEGATPGAGANSLTVVVTQCQAEIITWFERNASLKYTLESYHDYASGSGQPDPKCPSVGDAKGVTLDVIKANFPGLYS